MRYVLIILTKHFLAYFVSNWYSIYSDQEQEFTRIVIQQEEIWCPLHGYKYKRIFSSNVQCGIPVTAHASRSDPDYILRLTIRLVIVVHVITIAILYLHRLGIPSH